MNSKYYLTEVDKHPASIYCYFNLKGESFVESHQHQKGQFLYAEGGVVHVKTNVGTHYLPARHYMWIPPRVEHAIYPSSSNVVMKNLYFPIAHQALSFYNKIGIYPINSLLIELLLFTKNWQGDVFQIQKNKYVIVDAFRALLQQTASQSLLLELPHPKDHRLNLVINYLSEHIYKEHLLPQLASKFSMTDKSLYRLFKRDLNMSFIKYYTQLRIFKSLELLMNPNYNISEVATRVGYHSLPTFSNTFHKIMGKRPSEYRKSKQIYFED